MRMGPVEWILLLVLSLLWGGSFFFVEVAVAVVPPATLVLGRVAVGALVLWGLIIATRVEVPRTARDWRDLLVMGLLNNAIPFTLIVWGQQYITGGLASVLNAATPIFGVAVAHVLTDDEKATPLKLLGLALGLGGVAVLVGPDALQGLGGDVWGQIAILGAALSYAFAGVFGRRLRRFAPPMAAAGMLTGSTLIMVPVALWRDGVPAALPGMAPLLAWLALGLVSTGIAYILYFRILATAGTTNLLLVTVLVPPSAILLGALFLGEAVHLSLLAGLGLIMAGLAAVDGRLFDRLRPGRAAGEGAP